MASNETIRTPRQFMPGEPNSPHRPHNYQERRTYHILRQLQESKASADLSLEDLTDVNIASVIDGQALVWNAAEAEWENTTITAGVGTSSAAYASRPAGSEGDLFLTTNGYEIDRKGASTWSSWGPLYPFTAPDNSIFSWDNQGTASVSVTNGGIALTDVAGDSSTKARLRYTSAPATPWTLTVFMLHSQIIDKQFLQSGLMFRESSTGKLVSMHLQTNQIYISKWTNTGAEGADYFNSGGIMGPLYWWRVADDGSLLRFSYSADGQNFIEIFTKSRTDHMAGGPNGVGFFVNSENLATPNQAIALQLMSWKFT